MPLGLRNGSTLRGINSTLRGGDSFVLFEIPITYLASRYRESVLLAPPRRFVSGVLPVTFPLSTIPDRGEQASDMDRVYAIDTTPQLGPSQTPTSATATLTNLNSHTAVVLVDSPTIVLNEIRQRVRAGVLAAGGHYRLVVHFGISGATDTIDLAYVIRSPW